MNSLARTLAERLITQKREHRGGDAPFGWSADAHEVYAFDKLVLQTENEERADKCYAELIIKAEAIIREAIDKTLEEAASTGALAGGKWAQDVRNAIETLKQSKVRKA